MVSETIVVTVLKGMSIEKIGGCDMSIHSRLPFEFQSSHVHPGQV